MIWENLQVPNLEGFGGFVPPYGSGTSKVMIVGEAPGELEGKTGIPFHPKAPAGSTLDRLMRRAGVDREQFTLINSVWTRPPNNYLDGSRIEGEAIAAYAPFRDRAFEMFRPKVFLLMGNIALKSMTGYGGRKASITSCQGYVIDGPYSGTYCIPCLHPAALLRGEQRMSGVVIWAIQRALDIARNGFVRLPTRYITHPSLDDALEFERSYDPARHFLSYDIETAESSTLDEEELEDHEDISYNISRISLCYESRDGYAISLPWQQPFIDIARRMVGSTGAKRVWNGNFDNPRLAAAQCPVNGRIYDTMWAWKHLQPTLPRSLGFVTPFYGWTGEPWKHTSDSEMERYSCADAHALQQNADGIDEHLRQKGQWSTYERHVVQLGEVLTRMSQNGLPYSKEKAQAFETELQLKWDERFASLQERVPDELKPSKQKQGLKRVPKGLGNGETLNYVSRDFKVLYSDCTEAEQFYTYKERIGPNDIVSVARWCLLEPFLPTSTQQVQALLKHHGLPLGKNRKTKRDSADDEHLKKMCKRIAGVKRHAELLATLQMIRECRQLNKVLGTYVKGWRPGADGRIHATPGFWGDMYRVSWRRPNISATIQDKNEQAIAKGFRKCVAASSGHYLLESDWKSMEAVLVAYFADDKDYDRLARLGVHDYMACHILVERKKMSASALPSLSWTNADLKQLFKEVKNAFPKDRDDAKHTVHGISYGMTERLMSDMYEMPLSEAKRLIAMFFELFPKIKAWQRATLDRASRECKLRNPFTYEMPFWEVFRWDSKGQKWALGDDAKSAIAFLPRDTGAAMLKEVLLRLENKYQMASSGLLLASTHDSCLTEPRSESEVMDTAIRVHQEMTAPVAELGGLSIPVEHKWGTCWHESMMESLEVPELQLTT